MKTNKFKVGDKVRIKRGIGDHNDHNYQGETLDYIIKKYNNTFTIAMIGNHYEVEEDRFWCFDEKELELVKDFTKDDLQDGDIVTLRNGDKLVYTRHGFKDINDDYSNGIADNGDINKDLTYKYDNEYSDIVKVERPTTYTTMYEREEELEYDVILNSDEYENIPKGAKGKILEPTNNYPYVNWDKHYDYTHKKKINGKTYYNVYAAGRYNLTFINKEVKEMTIAEISKALGYEVKIVKEAE